MNWKNIAGISLGLGVLGLAGYSVYLYKRQQKEESEEITLDEAIEINEYRTQERRNNVIAFARKQSDIDKEEALAAEEEALLEEEHEEVLEDEPYEEELYPVSSEYKGGSKLRHDPNSNEAFEQFIDMELAEWVGVSGIKETMRDMFYIPFLPLNDGDKHLKDKIKDTRGEFFGEDSVWVDRVSFADIILHYARRTDFHVGGAVKYWVEYFIDLNGLDLWNLRDRMSDEQALTYIHNKFEDFCDHGLSFDYMNDPEPVNGLFGLNEEQMLSVRESRKNSTDGLVSFEMEFNEFIKTELNDFYGGN